MIQSQTCLDLVHQLTSIAHTYAVKSAYFEVIRIKKGLRIIPTHRARELKNVVDRSEMSCKCAGRGMDLTPFSLVALLQTLACNIGGQTHTHTRITCHTEHSITCTLFYKPEKVLSLCQNKKITPKLVRINRILISKFALTDIF